MVSNLSPLTVLPFSTSCVCGGGVGWVLRWDFSTPYCWCLLPFLLVIIDSYLSGPARQKEGFNLYEILGYGVLL